MLEIKPLNAPVGAQIFGLDAGAPISAADAAVLRDGLCPLPRPDRAGPEP